MKINCVIVEDDDLDRIMITAIVKKYPRLNLTGIFSTAEELFQKMSCQEITVLFLDIDLPGLTGLELRKKLVNIPICIFISAHPEYAIDSFNLDTLDFISKPLKTNRFEKCFNRIEEYLETKQKAALYDASIGGDEIIIKEGHQSIKIKLHEIIYLEALKDYTKIITVNHKHMVLCSIGNLLKKTHFSTFIRVQKSYAVQKNFIQKWDSNMIYLKNGITIPLSKNYIENLNF